MQEIFFTILVIWILFRVLNGNTWGSKNVSFTQNNFHPKEERKKEGETEITYKPPTNTNPKTSSSADEGEYVDFEEID